MKTPLALLSAALLVACVTETSSQSGEGGHYVEAKPNYIEAARANTRLGTEYTRKGQFELAMEKLLRALQQDDNYAPTHAAIALLYARRGEDELAESHYRRSLSLDEHDVSARNNFAIFLCSKGKTDEAIATFESLARDRSYDAPEDAWDNAGVCARRAGDLARAENYFREALNINPDFAGSLLQMASLSAQKQDWLRVRAFLQRRERSTAANAEALRLAAQAERQLGDFAAADRYEQKLAREFPATAPR